MIEIVNSETGDVFTLKGHGKRVKYRFIRFFFVIASQNINSKLYKVMLSGRPLSGMSSPLHQLIQKSYFGKQSRSSFEGHSL